MKFIKYSFLLAFAAVSLTSCLKDRGDQGGLYEDEGTIVTSIAERSYLNTDAQNIHVGYNYSNANFNFNNRPNEAVKFFTVVVNQPRKKKISGNLVLKVTTSAYAGLDGDGNPYPATVTAPPAGAINVTDIVIPASDANQIVVPVYFTVNKALLSAAVPDQYGLRFTLSSATEGVVSDLDKNIDVIINYSDAIFIIPGASTFFNVSDYTANYNYSNSFVDPLGIVGINNRKENMLVEMAPNQLEAFDPYIYPLSGFATAQQFIEVRNFQTGALLQTFKPRYILNTSGQVTSVVNANAAATVSNIQLDPSGENRFVYTNNNTRSLRVKYTLTYTTVVNGVSTPRTVSVSENYEYDRNQIYF